MLFYFGKHIESERVGQRVVRLECTKCGCEFFYNLTRIGKGSGTAPYGLGVSRATRMAQKRSQRDLDRRLQAEAELVPCPKCNWIPDELVDGFRRGRYRHYGIVAFCVGFVGTLASLMVAGLLSLGGPPDRMLVPYFLIGGPTLFIVPAVGIILLRKWLRSRIDPNRDYPFAPQLPPGSPPALVRQETSGELVPAKAFPSHEGVAVDWFDFQIGRHQFPPVCCGCLGAAAAGQGFKRTVTQTIQLDIPRCTDCAHDALRRSRRIWWTTTASGFVLGSAVLLCLNLESAEFWIFLFFALVISLVLATFAAWTATAPVKLVSGGDRSRGVIRLRFRNAGYARVLSEHIAEPSAALPRDSLSKRLAL